MRRRNFIAFLGGALAWPLVVRAQQPPKLPTIGFLGQSTLAVEGPRLAAFLKRLRELGWIEGHTIAFEYGWAEGSSERFAEIAADFVRLNVDVIVTSGTANVAAAKRATSTIPIVFAVAADLAGKRLEFLREAAPGIQHLAIIGNVGNPLTLLEIGDVRAAADRPPGLLQPSFATGTYLAFLGRLTAEKGPEAASSDCPCGGHAAANRGQGAAR